MNNHLAIIACSKRKIWDYLNNLGAVEAGCAYCGPEFLLAKHYASKLSNRVIILSAKYGFLDLCDTISGFYDVTFSRSEDQYVGVSYLKQQAFEKGLLRYKNLTIIANQTYQKKIYETFENTDVKINCPVADLTNEEEICLKINDCLLNQSK